VLSTNNTKNACTKSRPVESTRLKIIYGQNKMNGMNTMTLKCEIHRHGFN